MIRGLPALVICPNCALEKDVTGLLKLGRFNTLNTSQRRSNDSLSVARKILNAEASTLARPGPVRILRPAVPNVPDAGSPKRDVSNYFWMNCARDSSPYVATGPAPIKSARSPVPPERLRLTPAATENGIPLCSVIIPFNCQPARNARLNPVAPLKTCGSYTKDVTNRCAILRSDVPLS